MARLKSTTVDRARYDALLARQADLLARADELRSEVGSGVTTYRTTVSAAGNVTGLGVEEDLKTRAGRNQLSIESPKPKPVPKLRHPGAAALLEGLLPEQPPEELNPPDPPPSFAGEARYRDITREMGDITEALKLIGPEIEREHRAYSNRVLAERADEYRQIAANLVDTARAFGQAMFDQYRFIDSLRLSGVDWRNLRRLNITAFGDLADTSNPLKRLLADAMEQGHVSANKIPDWKLPVNHQVLMS